MCNSLSFANQQNQETLKDKINLLETCTACNRRDEVSRSAFHISGFPTQCQLLEDGEESTAVINAHELKDLKILGVHKQQMPRRSFYFVILVRKSDGSNLTIYRKWKELRAFQWEVKKLTKQDPLQADANYYLNNLRHKTSLFTISLSNGAMRRLRLIDSLNLYFQALVYYKALHQLEAVKKFFSPTEDDLNSKKRSGGGKTYFYLTELITSNSQDLTECDQSSELGYDQSDSVSQFSRDSLDSEVSAVFQASPTTMSIASTSSSGFDVTSRKALTVSAPMHGETHFALEDHEPSCDDCDHHHIMPLKKGDKVEVLAKNDCGWWFARCYHEDDAAETTGYVPASYLTKDDVKLGKSFSPLAMCGDPRSSAGDELMSISTDSSSCTDIRCLSDTTVPGEICSIFNRRCIDSPSFLRRFAGQASVGDYISKQSYTADKPDELSFVENSILSVLKKNENGWWLARYKGKEGLVPGVFLRKYYDPLHRLSLSVLNLNMEN